MKKLLIAIAFMVASMGVQAETTNCYDYGSSIDCTDSKGNRSTGWKYGDNNTEWTDSRGKKTDCWKYGNTTECTSSDGSKSTGYTYSDNSTDWTNSKGKKTECYRYGNDIECKSK